MSLFTIHKVHPKADCMMTGKETEAVEFSQGEDEASVIVGLNEFVKLVRMELRKAERSAPRCPSLAAK